MENEQSARSLSGISGAVYLLEIPPDLNVIRSLNPKSYLPLRIIENGYLDIVIDNDEFILISCKYEHPASPSVVPDHYAREISIKLSGNGQKSCRFQLTNQTSLM